MTRLITPPEGFPANCTVTWCPHCGEAITVEHRETRIDPLVVEERIKFHMSHYHRVRWWLWSRFGWKRAISGL